MNSCTYAERWERPFTAKRYLHPPFAERMLTMWPDLRIISGDVVEQTHGYLSGGYRILGGEALLPPDFAAVQYHVRPDGVPIHAVTQQLGFCTLHMESFSDVCRTPTAYSRCTLTNPTPTTVSDVLAILPRTGREDHLVGMEVDGYAHFDSNVHNWGFLPSHWRREGLVLTDDAYTLRLQDVDGFALEWQGDAPGLLWYQRRLLKLRYTLGPGESMAFSIAFCHGPVAPYDLAAERAKTLAFWQRELGRLRLFPGGEAYAPMLKSLAVQSMQMFCYPVGKQYVLPRQGGLQRVIWPVEAIEFLMALDRYGDFRDYTDTAYETFFFALQDKQGEHAGAVRNLSGNQWGSITGGSCWGCARHLLYLDDRAVFNKYRDSLLLAFGWMERQRDITRDGSCAGFGLFPPMQATDWPGQEQSWCITDATNLLGYRYMAEAFERFNDPAAPALRAAYDDYMACMRRVLDEEVALDPSGDEILLTSTVGRPQTDPPVGCYFSDGPGMLIRAGVVPAGGEVARRIENWYRNRGCMRNGLTGLMNDGMLRQGHNSDPYAGHTWYTSFSDLYWFYNWLDSGERDKARKTLDAQMRYGMTPEYYLLERYADNDPYWVPWMPNASANGRLMMMLADFYGMPGK